MRAERPPGAVPRRLGGFTPHRGVFSATSTLVSMKHKVRWTVGEFTRESPRLASRAAAEAWAVAHLPMGVLRYRTGTFEILTVRMP